MKLYYNGCFIVHQILLKYYITILACQSTCQDGFYMEKQCSANYDVVCKRKLLYHATLIHLGNTYILDQSSSSSDWLLTWRQILNQPIVEL